ncbi:4-(cytidine 5'-diphospho)-2-C-methyl-D-erythritol kinase [Breoghania sp.]|uniref:4-(cytidine 5'-diphospho)-2-C-methyl-D-erythritol kinase n=1 Tax=Breoghania sp. TaxID=2065378 RepID=UPI0029CA2A76|nr:4-(cytidine 5'-diphospho)-2-C-methyl-D-erythritol kinase [Breoghania sp.]
MPTPPAPRLSEQARAKVNLALHVTGRRADGYHELDTIAAFPPLGDTLHADPTDDLSLTIKGPFARDLTADGDNLVLRAAHALREVFAVQAGAALVLEKHLPVASGIGGGSADAAAALRILCRLWDIEATDPRLHEIAARLGADVPMCLASAPLRAQGIGDRLTPLAALPQAGFLLVNPCIEVSTPAVFRALASRENPAIGTMPQTFPDARQLAAFLRTTRNDLEPPATALATPIRDVLAALNGLPDVLLARMSGSGATCFAIFEDAPMASRAATTLQQARPDWWVAATTLS